MSRFEVSGIEGFADKVLKREAATVEAIPNMLRAGAAVLVKFQQDEIRSTFKGDRVTGNLENSVKSISV